MYSNKSKGDTFWQLDFILIVESILNNYIKKKL